MMKKINGLQVDERTTVTPVDVFQVRVAPGQDLAPALEAEESLAEEARPGGDEAGQPVVVIVGAGFGGLNAALTLRDFPGKVILLDKQNYHLFQPLLYQVATAGLSPSEIAYPVRAIFRKQRNLEFRLAEVESIDREQHRLYTSTGEIRYDYLILSVGSETNYFGLDSVAENGFDLKSLRDAVRVRNHILSVFELAAQAPTAEARRALLTFVVVGGGPTGVECAGALAELINLVLRKDFRDLEVSEIQVLLLEAMDRLLNGFPESLSEAALETLKHRGVKVRCEAAVERYDGCKVRLKGGETIPASTLIWAAGVRAAGLVGRLGLEQGRQGRVKVSRTLQTSDPRVFIVGDAAYLEEADGSPLPMVAPVAIQQAKTAARNIQHLVPGGQPGGQTLEEFVYKDPGSLATIGRNAAVARIGRFKFSGFMAWLVWLAVHLFWLIGYRNRLIVLFNWAWEYLFFERGVRLILDPTREAPQIKEIEPTPDCSPPVDTLRVR